MNEPLRVLIVEDSEKDAALMTRELRKAGMELEPVRVASSAALADALDGARWDLVLADFELPGFDAFAALAMVREVDAELPCVVVSGRIGEEVAVEAMRAGAQDFVPKDKLLRLPQVVQRELRDSHLRRAQVRDERRLAVQQAVASILASGRAPSECAREALGVIAGLLGWAFGALWRWDADERLLRCDATWSSSEHAAFESETRARALPAGVDLPGMVVDTGRSTWVADLAREIGSQRASAAARAGLHASLAVPIRIEGEVSHVIEAFHAHVQDEDRDLLTTIEIVAAQLGQALGRERALDALRESEALKAAVLEAALDAVITMDHRGRILEFNPAAERIFGYSREEVIGREMAPLLLPPSLGDALRRGVARYLATGEAPLLSRRIEMPAMRKDGAEFPAEIAITRVDRSGQPVFTGFVRDVTQSVKLFGALRAAEARQRLLADVGAALVESLDHRAVLPRVAVLLASEIADWCAIHLSSERGGLEQVAAAHRLSAKTPLIEELWRRRPPSLECDVGPAAVARTGEMRIHENVSDADIGRFARDADEARILRTLGVGSYLAVPLVAHGSTLGVLSVVLEPGHGTFASEDVELCVELARRCATAVDNAQLHREVQASLRARDDFLALAAHELQTPITPLRIRAQQLTRLVEESEGGMLSADRVADGVHAIERSSVRLAELVDRLLEVSRLTVGRMALERTSFDLVALARSVVLEMNAELRRCGSEIVWDVPAQPILGAWDRRRVGIAFKNLLSNALKFAPGRPIEVAVRVDGPVARVSVRDHGPGLAPADRGRLFERFARPASLRHYGGFGLGLWIVRQVAEEHGGRVDVWSEPGAGARFEFTLPLPS